MFRGLLAKHHAQFISYRFSNEYEIVNGFDITFCFIVNQ